MVTTSATGYHIFDGPATYQIQIQGRLDVKWSARLENMAICVNGLGSESCVTTLYGELPDQAALVGVLNQLYAMRVAVLSVTRIEDTTC
jgi:hypothetical protein